MSNADQLGDITKRLRAAEAAIASLRKRAPLSNASISEGGLIVKDGGNIVIKGGGSLLIEDAGGNVLIRVGEGPDGNYGLVVNDTDGNPQIRAGELASGGYGLEAVDASGNLVQLSALAFGITSSTLEVFPPETTTSTSYTDLATVGPTVTVVIGQSGRALVSVTAYLVWTLNRACGMSFAISGATTRAVDANLTLTAATADPSTVNASGNSQATATFLVEGLTPGSTTFTAKYCSLGGGSVSFGQYRNITVQPF